MLDLTGVMSQERPELMHLAALSACSISNALLLRQAHHLLLRLNWPGHGLGEDNDGLVGLDADGFVSTSNSAARQLLPLTCGLSFLISPLVVGLFAGASVAAWRALKNEAHVEIVA
jgi:transcriptional regulator of acetoin/glycerol metabolism